MVTLRELMHSAMEAINMGDLDLDAPVAILLQCDCCGGGRPVLAEDIDIDPEEQTLSIQPPWEYPVDDCPPSDTSDMAECDSAAADAAGGISQPSLRLCGPDTSPE
jgi:hypothetical protein